MENSVDESNMSYTVVSCTLKTIRIDVQEKGLSAKTSHDDAYAVHDRKNNKGRLV